MAVHFEEQVKIADQAKNTSQLSGGRQQCFDFASIAVVHFN